MDFRYLAGQRIGTPAVENRNVVATGQQSSNERPPYEQCPSDDQYTAQWQCSDSEVRWSDLRRLIRCYTRLSSSAARAA